MKGIGDFTPVELYREFADNQTAESPCFHAWAEGVADDAEVLARIATLPGLKRQPNLVFTAARWHGAAVGPYDGLRQVLLERWPDVEATVLSRATQTNEVGRCATLLPVLASLPGPLALLEVGCSAGLCLLPDRYSYRYTGSRGSVAIDPVDGPSPVVIECLLEGDVPLPGRLPEVVWRGGLDLNPLDVHDDDAMRWLQMLVWPEHEDRRARLAAAVDARARRSADSWCAATCSRTCPRWSSRCRPRPRSWSSTRRCWSTSRAPTAPASPRRCRGCAGTGSATRGPR